jgi:Flp pilus assembly protein TadG
MWPAQSCLVMNAIRQLTPCVPDPLAAPDKRRLALSPSGVPVPLDAARRMALRIGPRHSLLMPSDTRQVRPVWRRLRHSQRGQSLVEFALVIPIFLVMFIAILEFALVLNSVLAINFATREASLIGAEAGNASDADCVILAAVEHSVGAPSAPNQITSVRIYQANRVGAVIPGRVNSYVRTGETVCNYPDGTVLRVPYSPVGGPGYPEASRCNVLAGCGGSTTLDQIGVEVTYQYAWRTPMHTLLGWSGAGYTMVKSNAMRMEPIL